eukprot:CAMPEP_0203761566 /NCGR_PEP_ID=MMETSP0098-20131031/14621_1 /ASSEMBLY_ACC=CAM_ASM_000208 /TAXON_ID=96639 /ORGANISM=" , Strain NY0313808BC1" /LENGTH=330 /DNA_ID=CAMNT_0050655605 /DNA_START=380 /DNA_END=1369 /DNA_ORIENTATION=+
MAVGYVGYVIGRVQDMPEQAHPLVLYVLLNLSVLSVEICYGAIGGSLGLVCDGVHMFINCFGITLSLIAVECSNRSPSLESSYGFDRIHVLSAFTNAVFLGFVAMFIVVEAVMRFGEENNTHADHVVSVALVGLTINVVGLALLGVSSRRGKQAQKKLGKRFSSSIGSPTGSMDSYAPQRYAQLLNLQGVLLHAMCDVVSSVGVITSSLLVQYYGWDWADPLMSLLIAALIYRSTIPFLISSGQTLLQVAPVKARSALDKSIREITMVTGVLECSKEHMWTFSPDVLVTTVHIRIRDDANESDVLLMVNRLLSSVSQHVTIQIDKDHVSS